MAKDVTKTHNTAKPTGLKIARSGNKFTFSWGVKDKDYNGGCQVKYYIMHQGKWSSPVNRSPTQPYSVTMDATKYIPATSKKLSSVHFAVRAKRKTWTETVGDGSKRHKVTHKYKWTEWSDADKKVNISPPPIPKITLTPGESDGTIELGWNVAAKKDDLKPFTKIQYRTQLAKNQKNNKFADSGWSNPIEPSNASSSSGTVTIYNSTTTLSDGNSHTRAVQVRAGGPGGWTKWEDATKYYVYATPKAAKISQSPKIANAGTGYSCTVSWSPEERSFDRPIDSYEVEYLIATPANADLDPPSTSWTSAGIVVDSPAEKTSSLHFTTDDRPAEDEAFWVRVKSTHGTRTTVGQVKLVEFGGVKGFEDPFGVNVEYDTSTKTLTLSGDVPSEMPGAYIVARFKNKNTRKLVNGYSIPASSGTRTVSVDYTKYSEMILETMVRITDSGGNDRNSAIQSRTYNVRTEATDPYEFCPTGLSLSPGSTAGTIDVSWTDARIGATGADVSYSTNEDAWAGEDYTTVAAATTTGTSIPNFEYGVRYYFSARQKNSKGTTKWSAYNCITLKQTDIPRPVLKLSQGPTKDSIKATWSWSTWGQAESIELSWADNANAWGSSNSPNSKEVKRTVSSSGEFYITGLERDKTWYVKAKFLRGTVESGYVTRSFRLTVTPAAPTGVKFARTSVLSTARVSWTWAWDDAETAEITWADNKEAWDSTEGPKSTTIDRGRSFIDIPNLETGKRWYAKVKLIYDKFSAESGIVSVDLRTAPDKPVVRLSDSIISSTLGRTDVSWTYECDDGMEQASASVRLATVSGSTVTIGRQIASVADVSTTASVYAETARLTTAQDYWICVRTTSTTGLNSAWSDPVKLTVVSKPIATITSTSLDTVTMEDDQGVEYTAYALTSLPLTMSVTGIGTHGTVTGYIERAESFFLDRPDESTSKGHEGELIVMKQLEADGTFTFDLLDLIGDLDDGAKYRLGAIVADPYGQTDETGIDFTVMWAHQAVMPEATVETDTANLIVKITPTAPTGAGEGDTVDIYRLSADKPELIVKDAAFGTTYVDPYPAFGEAAGHRIVYRTIYGDFITAEGRLAMLDFLTEEDSENQETLLPEKHTVIDFGGMSVQLDYNLDISNSWEKDFTETKYLGGSVQGDWNPAVSRTGSVSSVAVTLYDQDTIRTMRRLAVYPGICHVRTPDGSSYAADVQVKEDRSHDTAGKLANFSLDITRVDSDRYEGMTLAEWEAGEDSGESGESGESGVSGND